MTKTFSILILLLTSSAAFAADQYSDVDPVVSCSIISADKSGKETKNEKEIQNRRMSPGNLTGSWFEVSADTDLATIVVRVSDKNQIRVSIAPKVFTSGKAIGVGSGSVETTVYTSSNFGKAYNFETYDRSKIQVSCRLDKEIGLKN